MRQEEVIITFRDERNRRTHYLFHEPELCVVGRNEHCDIRVPADEHHQRISRHHCLLEIDPPRVFLTDLGSSSGTFVNGERIGASRSHHPELVRTTRYGKIELKNGDRIELGGSPFWLLVATGAETDDDREPISGVVRSRDRATAVVD